MQIKSDSRKNKGIMDLFGSASRVEEPLTEITIKEMLARHYAHENKIIESKAARKKKARRLVMLFIEHDICYPWNDTSYHIKEAHEYR
jgi:hypothetical protein